MKKNILFSLFIAFTIQGFAAKYYISSSDPMANDSYTTTSPTAPWKSISKLSTVVFSAGDSVFLKCNDTFRGSAMIGKGGTAAAHLVITSYSTGNKPLIKGSELVTNWTATGNYYTTTYNGAVTNFFVNEKAQTLARYPNEHSYLSLDSAKTSYLKDASLAALNPNLINGAKICVHPTQWSWEKTAVASFSGTKINYSSLISKALNNYGYFLFDNLAHLDTANEWKYDATSHNLYYYPPANVNPNNATCEVATYNNGIELAANVAYVDIINVAFAQQSNAGILIGNADNKYITIQNCSFAQQYLHGVNVKGKHCHIYDSYFREIEGIALYVNGSGSGATTVDHNVFKNNGVTRANGLGNQLNGTALMCASDSNYFHHNQIDSTGYCGISADGAYNLVERNIVDHAMLIENDGAAIKGWESGTHHSIYRNNFVFNSDGNTEGAYQATFLTPAIYFDFNVHDCIISENTIYNHAQRGIFQNSSNHNNTITGNVILGGSVLLDLNGTGLAPNPVPITGMVIKHNSFFAKDNNAVIVRQVDFQETTNHFNMGVLDSNYYFQPYNVNRYALRMESGNPHYYTFTDWQATGNDANTKSSFVNWQAGTSLDTLVMNQTDNVQTIALSAHNYLTLDNQTICGMITLQPYTSAILIKTNSVCTPNSLENPQNFTFNLYPNPASEQIFLQSSEALQKIEVMNASGSTVLRLENPTENLAISQLASGMYFVKCWDTAGRLAVKKMVKE